MNLPTRIPCVEKKPIRLVYAHVAGYRRRGPVGEGDVCLIDENGEERPFIAQLFNNR